MNGMYQVAFVPVLCAGILSALIGIVWYHPRFFGSAWMRLSGFTPEMVERSKKRRWLTPIVGVLASMLIAYVMAYVAIALGVYDWIGAVEVGLWCWIGFVAPTSLGIVLWEQKPLRLYAITAGYWLVSFIAISLVLFYI